MEDYLKFAKGLAYQAGDIMVKHFKIGVDYTEKNELSTVSIVTLADREVNDLVIREVEKMYPNTSVFGEEKSVDKKSEDVWVCDPVDGTVPYAKGLPVSVFSLALVRNGIPFLGVVFDPFMKRLYSAVRGGGAFMNDVPLKVSRNSLNYQATVNIEWWPEADYDIDTKCHGLSMNTKTYVLHLGSTIHGACMVASGQYEAMIFAGTKGKNVDIAAVKVIVEEAGGKVTDLFGNEQRYDQDIKGAIVSNGIVHDDLIKYLSLS